MSHFEYASFYKISKHKNTVFNISKYIFPSSNTDFLKKKYLAIFPIVSRGLKPKGNFTVLQ